MQPVPIEKKFDSYRDFRAAALELLGCTTRELLLFDTDLRETQLESPDTLAGLRRALAATPSPTVRIVLHDADFFESACPRLFALYGRYRHVMEVRRSAENLRHLSELFAIADATHLLVRFHRDHARGKLLLFSPDEASGWRKRFLDLWEASSEAVPANRLGL